MFFIRERFFSLLWYWRNESLHSNIISDFHHIFMQLIFAGFRCFDDWIVSKIHHCCLHKIILIMKSTNSRFRLSINFIHVRIVFWQTLKWKLNSNAISNNISWMHLTYKFWYRHILFLNFHTNRIDRHFDEYFF